MIFTVFVDIAKGADPLLAIRLNNDDKPVQYCTTPKYVAESLTIDGTFAITGMFVSISQGYISGEDELAYSGAISSIKGTWDALKGVMHLVPTGSVTPTNYDYRDAIKTVTYKNNKTVPTLGVREISITLDDADYLDETKHFYQFISAPGIYWKDARDKAASTFYHDVLRGYLATITSQKENNFINLRTNLAGWIGATDETVEGDWRWVTGPEGQLNGGQGLLFWKGTGAQAKTNPAMYGSQNNAYQNWNTVNNEPNNANNENYAHITVFTTPDRIGQSHTWNDLSNNGSNNSPGNDYYPAGYLIEYGGLPGEPVLELSATLELQVNTMLFNTDPIPTICEGMSVKLNIQDSNWTPGIYSWEPTEFLSNPAIPSPTTSPNPMATPKITTTYTVTGTRGACRGTAKYTVTVNPQPVSLLNPVENICKDQTKMLDPGLNPGYTYLWNNGSTTQTITVGAAGDYNVTIKTDKGCTAPSFMTKVVIHDYPTIDLSKLQMLICGEPKSTTVKITTNATDYSLISIDGKATVSGGLNVNVPVDGVYPMVYKSALYPTCPVEKNFDLSFFKTPKVSFDIDTTACHGYNLDATYNGDADIVKARFTWIFGGDTIADGIGRYKEKISLGVNKSNRNLVLKVEQNGCSNQHTISDIRVIPTLSLFVMDSIRCLPDAFEFSASNTEIGVTYDWNFGDRITGTGTNPSHKYANDGKYNIQLKVTTDKNCSNTVIVPEMVYAAPVPTIGFSLSPDDCLNPGVNQISYLGSGNIRDKYFWDLTQFDKLLEIITDPQLTQGPFKFDLKTKPSATLGLKVTSEFGCESLPGSIIVKRKPDFSILANIKEGCIPFEPNLSGIINDTIDRVDFSWDFGDGATDSGSPVAHAYNEPDKKFSIILTGKSRLTQCTNELTNSEFFKTYPKPTAVFSMDNKIVYNDKPDVKFTDNSMGATDFSWDFGDGTTSILQNPSHHFVKTGHLIVLLEVTNTDLCTDTVSQKLLVAFDRLFPPNGFSPNAPNIVDREFLLNSEGITPEGYHFTVLSRWNDLIFEAKDEIKGWDGRKDNGIFAPAGVYVWTLNFTDFLGRKHRQTGTVTLVY